MKKVTLSNVKKEVEAIASNMSKVALATTKVLFELLELTSDERKEILSFMSEKFSESYYKKVSGCFSIMVAYTDTLTEEMRTFGFSKLYDTMRAIKNPPKVAKDVTAPTETVTAPTETVTAPTETATAPTETVTETAKALDKSSKWDDLRTVDAILASIRNEAWKVANRGDSLQDAITILTNLEDILYTTNERA